MASHHQVGPGEYENACSPFLLFLYCQDSIHLTPHTAPAPMCTSLAHQPSEPFPLLPAPPAGAARATHMAWNWREVLAVLLASPAFKLALAGHDHVGGYAAIEGRHFITLEALLEAPPAGNAYGVVHVHPGRLVLEGHGTVTSRELPLQPGAAAAATPAQ